MHSSIQVRFANAADRESFGQLAGLDPEHDHTWWPVTPEGSSQRGGVYLVGQHRLMCGDATDPRDREQLLAGDAPGVVVLDPPFELPEKHWHRLIHDPCILFGQAKHMRAIPEQLWRFERLIVKPHGHRSATVQVLHRHAFVAQVGSARQLPEDPGTFDSVWMQGQGVAAYEKPVKLLVEHLTHWTPPWRICVDWFAGSGTTMAACEQMGRRCLAMEMDPIKCDAIRARMADPKAAS